MSLGFLVFPAPLVKTRMICCICSGVSLGSGGGDTAFFVSGLGLDEDAIVLLLVGNGCVSSDEILLSRYIFRSLRLASVQYTRVIIHPVPLGRFLFPLGRSPDRQLVQRFCHSVLRWDPTTGHNPFAELYATGNNTRLWSEATLCLYISWGTRILSLQILQNWLACFEWSVEGYYLVQW